MSAKISIEARAEVERALAEYHATVERCESSGLLKPNTAKTYLLHADNFVRWLRGDFDPGARNR